MTSVTRRSARDRDSRRDELLERLLDALKRNLAEGRAYMDISVADLIAEGELARSTFYRHFNDKGDLVRLWFGQTRADLVEASEAWWELGPRIRREDLRRALAELVRTYEPHAPMMAAVYDAAAYDRDVREEVAGLMSENIEALRTHIEAGQKAGWVDSNISAYGASFWLMWMAERTMHQAVLRPGVNADEREAHIDAFTSIVWRTLYARASEKDAAT